MVTEIHQPTRFGPAFMTDFQYGGQKFVVKFQDGNQTTYTGTDKYEVHASGALIITDYTRKYVTTYAPGQWVTVQQDQSGNVG
jgi:hypothetical protein